MTPEIPLPASNEGLAEIMRTSLCTVGIEHFASLSTKLFTFVLSNDMFQNGYKRGRCHKILFSYKSPPLKFKHEIEEFAQLLLSGFQ